MNLQTQKINIIHRIIQVNDEKIISEIDSILSSSLSNENVKPMSLEAFYRKIDEAEIDIAEGKTITHSALKEEVKKW